MYVATFIWIYFRSLVSKVFGPPVSVYYLSAFLATFFDGLNVFWLVEGKIPLRADKYWNRYTSPTYLTSDEHTNLITALNYSIVFYYFCVLNKLAPVIRWQLKNKKNKCIKGGSIFRASDTIFLRQENSLLPSPHSPFHFHSDVST